MRDFCKLFRVDGIGQILATVVEAGDVEVPALELRIPDHGGMIRRVSLTWPSLDYDEAEEAAYAALAALDEDGAKGMAGPILSLSARLSDAGPLK